MTLPLFCLVLFCPLLCPVPSAHLPDGHGLCEGASDVVSARLLHAQVLQEAAQQGQRLGEHKGAAVLGHRVNSGAKMGWVE